MDWKKLLLSESDNADWEIRHDSKTKEITLLYVPEDGYSNNDIEIKMPYEHFEDLVNFIIKIQKQKKEKEILEATKEFAEIYDIPYDDRIESMILNAMRDNYMRCYKTFYCKCDAPLIRTNVNNGEYCGKCGFNFKQ